MKKLLAKSVEKTAPRTSKNPTMASEVKDQFKANNLEQSGNAYKIALCLKVSAPCYTILSLPTDLEKKAIFAEVMGITNANGLYC